MLEKLEKLKELGLAEYEVRVYNTLLRLGSAKGGEISRKSGVPHGKTYVALNQLADKGLITILPIKPKLFRIIDPKIGIKRLLGDKTQRIEKIGDDIINSLKEVRIPEKERAYEKFEIIAGYEKSFGFFHEVSLSAKKEVLLISRGEKVPYQTYRDGKRLIDRGIDFKFVIFQFNGNRDEVKKFVDLGWNVRYYSTGKFSLWIKDREESFLVVRNPKDMKDRITIHFRDEAISRALAEYFYVIWKKGKPIKF